MCTVYRAMGANILPNPIHIPAVTYRQLGTWRGGRGRKTLLLSLLSRTRTLIPLLLRRRRTLPLLPMPLLLYRARILYGGSGDSGGVFAFPHSFSRMKKEQECSVCGGLHKGYRFIRFILRPRRRQKTYMGPCHTDYSPSNHGDLCNIGSKMMNREYT